MSRCVCTMHCSQDCIPLLLLFLLSPSSYHTHTHTHTHHAHAHTHTPRTHTMHIHTRAHTHTHTHTPGGSVTAGLGIYDTMRYIRPPVATWCVGQACSMGAFLLAAGEGGRRHCLPHSRIMIHQPHGATGVRSIQCVSYIVSFTEKRISVYQLKKKILSCQRFDQMLQSSSGRKRSLRGTLRYL